eukprot:ctg_277.g109
MGQQVVQPGVCPALPPPPWSSPPPGTSDPIRPFAARMHFGPFIRRSVAVAGARFEWDIYCGSATQPADRRIARLAGHRHDAQKRLPPARVPSDQSAAAAAAAVAGAQHGDDDSDRAAAALFALSASPAVGAAPPMARHSDSFSVGVRGAVNTSAHRGGSYLELPTSLGNTPNLQAAEVLEARPLGASPMPRTDSATFFQDAAAHGTPHRWQAPMSALRHRVGVPSQAMTTGTSQPPSISGSGLTPFLQEDAFRSGMSSVLLGPGRNGQADVGITPELHGGTAAMLDALVGGSVQERSTGTPAGANMLGLFGTPNLIPNHGLEHTMQWLPPETRQRRAAAAVEDERPLKATPRLHEHLCRDFAVSEELSHADAAGSGESPGGTLPRVEKRRRRALDKPPSPPLPPSPPPDADMQADPAALESSATYQEALEFLQRLRGEQYERPPCCRRRCCSPCSRWWRSAPSRRHTDALLLRAGVRATSVFLREMDARGVVGRSARRNRQRLCAGARRVRALPDGVLPLCGAAHTLGHQRRGAATPREPDIGTQVQADDPTGGHRALPPEEERAQVREEGALLVSQEPRRRAPACQGPLCEDGHQQLGLGGCGPVAFHILRQYHSVEVVDAQGEPSAVGISEHGGHWRRRTVGHC